MELQSVMEVHDYMSITQENVEHVAADIAEKLERRLAKPGTVSSQIIVTVSCDKMPSTLMLCSLEKCIETVLKDGPCVDVVKFIDVYAQGNAIRVDCFITRHP